MGERVKRVGVVTGTRAEYGLWGSVLEAIAGRGELELGVVVTGMHLLERFGGTVREVRGDGWRIIGEVGLQGEEDDAWGQAVGLGGAISGMAEAFRGAGTEVVMVLGDRIEAFAGAAAGAASGLVVGHVHGGERAPGVNDEAYRHAITKLAHVHFAATAGAAQRILRMGEEAWRVHEVGSPGLDGIEERVVRDAGELSRWAGFDVTEKFLLVAQHPAGGTAEEERERMLGTLTACEGLAKWVLVVGPNSDAGFSGIMEAIGEYEGRGGYRSVASLPRGIYLGLLARCRSLVGNSSSGLIEAEALNVDVVNVGDRQEGRERGGHVRDVAYGPAVRAALMESPGRGRRIGRPVYGDGQSGRRIAEILASLELDGRLRRKRITY